MMIDPRDEANSGRNGDAGERPLVSNFWPASDECARGRRACSPSSVSDQDEAAPGPKLHGSANSRSPCSRSLRNLKNAMRSATNSSTCARFTREPSGRAQAGASVSRAH